MFRVHHFMRQLVSPTPLAPRRAPPGPVVIWNLIRRCNLTCKHCYTNSFDRDFEGKLTTAEALRVLDDLHAAGVRVVILSGGEPLLRPDVLELGARAKALGLYTGLSSNGTLIGPHNVDAIAAVGFDYLGVSLDGLGATNDAFRRKAGAFDAALAGVRLAQARGVKVGLRFCLTRDTAADLPRLLRLLDEEGLDKFYLSHLNYAGRGATNRRTDAHFAMTRAAMDLLFDEALRCARAGVPREFVTGNNDADGVYLLQWAQARFPERVAHLRQHLVAWGGNASGVGVANIDSVGEVHPDSFWQTHALGNVRRRRFADIWADVSSPLMAGLKRRPRPVTGRCGACPQLDVCNGNTRVRAWTATGDFWSEDPGCYLTDEELAAAALHRAA